LRALIYKKLFSPSPAGFPWYFTYLTVVSIVPSAGFFRTARPFINWRAFSFTFFVILLISLLWEVTLAIPFGWWGYRSDMMLGITIDAWSGLPIEAVGVWLAVSFTAVITYEVIKIWQALGRGAWEAFFGIRLPTPSGQTPSSSGRPIPKSRSTTEAGPPVHRPRAQ
jgi:hypothetical protein